MSNINQRELAKIKKMLSTGIDMTPKLSISKEDIEKELPRPRQFKMWVGENGSYPAPATDGSAGYDISSAEDIVIPPKQTVLVSTEVRMALLPGWGGFLFSRSGLGAKKGIAVAQGVGVIDSDYRGEIKVPLYNRTEEEFSILKGDDIAQMVFLPYALISFTYVDSPKDLERTDRGEGGFGSTDNS